MDELLESHSEFCEGVRAQNLSLLVASGDFGDSVDFSFEYEVRLYSVSFVDLVVLCPPRLVCTICRFVCDSRSSCASGCQSWWSCCKLVPPLHVLDRVAVFMHVLASPPVGVPSMGESSVLHLCTSFDVLPGFYCCSLSCKCGTSFPSLFVWVSRRSV